MKMRTTIGGGGDQARITLVELVVVVVVIVVVAGYLLHLRPKRGHRYTAQGILCMNHLKEIGTGFLLFAAENDERFPQSLMLSNGMAISKINAVHVFGALSNQLSSPKILHCLADSKSESAGAKVSFEKITAKNVSYFVSLNASTTNPLAFLAGDRHLMTNGKAIGPGLFELTTNTVVSWSKEIHLGMANIAMADGSVVRMKSSTLREAVGAQEMGTNYLAIP